MAEVRRGGVCVGEAVWFVLYRVQGEGTRVSDHSAKDSGNWDPL